MTVEEQLTPSVAPTRADFNCSFVDMVPLWFTIETLTQGSVVTNNQRAALQLYLLKQASKL